MIYALDIAAWDMCLGSALILAGVAFPGPGLAAFVRRGLRLSGAQCLAGLLGAAVGNIDVRNIGIIGGAVKPPCWCCSLIPPLAVQLISDTGSWIPPALFAVISGVSTDVSVWAALLSVAAWALVRPPLDSWPSNGETSPEPKEDLEKLGIDPRAMLRVRPPTGLLATGTFDPATESNRPCHAGWSSDMVEA